MSQLVASTCAKYREARTQAPVYHVAITSVTLLTTGKIFFFHLKYFPLLEIFSHNSHFVSLAFLGTMVSGIWLSYLVLMLALMLPGLHRLVLVLSPTLHGFSIYLE